MNTPQTALPFSPSQTEDSPTPSPQPKNFTTSFEIFTNGTKRVFTSSMYHNQSDKVYIESSDPSLVRIQNYGTTWDDFFTTLPFTLTKNCLVTGTKQTFCTTESKTLRFFLNEQVAPNALDRVIQPSDRLRIEYGR